MTARHQPAAGGPGCAIVRAHDADISMLSQVIADAFLNLAPCRWLIDDPAARRVIFPGYFRMYVEHAIAGGLVDTTPGRDAAALWIPTGSQLPSPPDGYDEHLAQVTGRWAGRFAAFDRELHAHHLTGAEHRRVAPARCRAGAPSGPCMRVVLAHGPGKPLGAVRVQCHSTVLPARRRAGCCSRRQVACTRCARVSFPAAG